MPEPTAPFELPVCTPTELPAPPSPETETVTGADDCSSFVGSPLCLTLAYSGGSMMRSFGGYGRLIGMPMAFWSRDIISVGTLERTLPGFFSPSICHVNGANWLVGSTQSCLREAR